MMSVLFLSSEIQYFDSLSKFIYTKMQLYPNLAVPSMFKSNAQHLAAIHTEFN